ncbi:unnamed protein product [Lactuca virosa]|uniref:Uncharacterized protein n=1 Tax=Lactuca virosa TaxID=75947 RepID=A0AAU9PW07_9ASTR|nr:unnamed protein product [Lactuca virosa]
MYVENRMLRMPETENDMKMTTGMSRCEPSIIGVCVINTAQKLDEMMLRTTMAALFHPTTKMYCLPLKAFVSHSLHKPQRLINLKIYPRADRTILSINTPCSLSSTEVPQISNDTTSDLDSSYLSCSMTNSKRPLKLQFFSVVALIAVLHFASSTHPATPAPLSTLMSGSKCEDFQNFWSECPCEEDLKYVKAVCNQVAVALEVVHLTDEYWDKVVSHTPLDAFSHIHHHQWNLLLTSYSVAGAFMDAISNMDFEFVASGPVLMKSEGLPENLICLTKKEGIHREYAFLGRYVVEKDVKNNVVFVSRNYYSVDKTRRSFLVGSSRWISGSPPHNLNHLRCKVRHGPLFYDCSLHIEEKDGVILESWDDAKGFHVSVSDKARHIAKMEDKSKLERKQEQLKNEINLEEKIFNLSNRIDQLLCIISSLCTAHQVLEQWAKSGGISYNDYVELCAKKEAVSELGKEAKLDMFELPAKIKLLPDPWTPESGLVTAALKLKRDQMKAKFMDDLQKLYE